MSRHTLPLPLLLLAMLPAALLGCGGGGGKETPDSGSEQGQTVKSPKRPKPLKLSAPERKSQTALKVRVKRSFNKEVAAAVKSGSARPPKCAQSTKRNWFVCQVRSGRKLYTYLVKVRSDGSWTATGTVAYTKLTKAQAKKGVKSTKPPALHGSVH